MLPFSWPSCYFKTRLPSCALGTSFYTVLEGRDLMTYISDNYTSYSAPSPLKKNPHYRVKECKSVEVFLELVAELKSLRTKMKHIIIFCQTIKDCTTTYYFLRTISKMKQWNHRMLQIYPSAD